MALVALACLGTAQQTSDQAFVSLAFKGVDSERLI